MTERHCGELGQQRGRRPAGQEVEWISEQDRLQVGDRLHPRYVADYLRLLLDGAHVIHRQAVQQVHQDHHDQEDEGDEEGEGDPGQPGAGVDGDVGELQLADEHGDGLDETGPGTVEVDIVIIVRDETRQVLKVKIVTSFITSKGFIIF